MESILREMERNGSGVPRSAYESSESPDDDMMQKILSGDFSSLGLPMPSSMPTPAEAQQEARERSTKVLSHWRKLQQILERHEDVIRKRWNKKTKSQRTAILLRAWPHMSPTHRPDYKALQKEGPQLKSRGTKFREAYVWPYINVEDLARGKTLLLLLNSRGRHVPSVFAHADFEAMRLGHVSGAVMPAFLNLYTMLLDGESVETYGRLVSWDDDQDAMMNCFTGLAFQPGQGLLILEIQEKILHFLLECCQEILHDVTPSALISEVQIKPEPPSLADSSEWPTLASIAAEAHYRLPAQLDFLRLKRLVAARCSSVEDHIGALREDPGYFAEVLGDWSEHRQEKLLDTNGVPHPVLDTPLFWERVIGNVLLDAYGALVVWNIIKKQLNHLAALQEKYSDVIKPTKLLPAEYMKMLLTFRHTLSQVKNGPILTLKTGVVASPPLRSLFVREPHIKGSTMIRVRSKGGSDPMLWLFTELWTEEQLTLLGLPGLVDEMEYLMQSDPKEKARFSPWVARTFSELGLIARLQHELDIYQPWAAGFDHEYANFKKEIQADFSRQFDPLAKIQRNFKEGSLATSLSKFGSPTEARFYYPSDKRRTKSTTESMQKAEHNLDLFWGTLDQYHRQKTGKSVHESVKHLLSQTRPLERTADWVEPIKEPKSAVAGKAKQDLNESLSSMQLEPANDSSKFFPSQPKIKPKTRGSATNNSDTAPTAPLIEDKQPVFTLKSRAFKVFKVLFFNPSQSDLPGEVSWADFLHAMSTTGFAPEKLYGSIWQFTPLKLDVERSIQFHEPHPIGKIPFRNARRIGRRLNRAYGWHGGMFALE